jgi:activator of HSP90 ATPase
MKSMPTAIIRQKVTMPASAAEVYTAFTDPKQHNHCTGAKAAGSPKVGGKFSAWDGYIKAKYLILEPDKKIVQEWSTTDWEQGYPASTLTLTLTQKARGTEIAMVQTGVPESQSESFAKGWKDFYWTPMKAYFSGRSS